jgi:hypothetical protein
VPVADPARQSATSPPAADTLPLRQPHRPGVTPPLRDLHAALGNAAVQQRLLQRAVQRQPLDVAPLEDEHEKEAERLADRMSEGLTPSLPGPAPGGGVWRAPAPEDEKKKAAAPAPAPKATEAQGSTPAQAGAAPTPAQPEQKKKDEPAVAAKADPGAGATTPQVTSAVTSSIASGGGRPLPGEARSSFESQLGSDLGAVRVHDDAAAATAASDLGARAFTYGSDVYFGGGRYQPHTSEGRKLLAHELVHTVQQRPGGALRRAIQRQADAPPPSTPGSAGTGAGATAPPAAESARGLPLSVGRLEGEGDARTVHFEHIEIPPFKAQGHRLTVYGARKPLSQVKSYDRGNPDQRTVWSTTIVPDEPIRNRLRTKHGEAPAPGQPWLFKGPGTTNRPYFASPDLDAIAARLNLPTWDRSGAYHRFDVDHIVELQLAGWTGSGPQWANTCKDNMELLDSARNRSSGSLIQKRINTKLNAFLERARSDPDVPDTASLVKRDLGLVFDSAVAGDDAVEVGPNDFWTYEEITRGDHLEHVEVAHASELGSEGSIKVFPSPVGGVPRTMSWSGSPEPASGERDYMKPFRLMRKEFRVQPEQLSDPVLGVLTFQIPVGNPKWEASEPRTAEIRRLPGLPYAGSIDKTQVRTGLQSLRKKGASPIEVDEPTIAPGGIQVTGRILPELPALRGGIGFELLGDNFSVYKEFTFGDVELPRPFAIDDITLLATIGTESGIQLDGRVDFRIERVGRGFVAASIGTSSGLGLEGSFDFDNRLFDPARITVRYADGAWSGSGDLGIPAGKVPGIRRAQVHVEYAEGRLQANGSAQLTVPGVEEGTMSLTYSETDGLAVGGSFRLRNDVPGIRGGQVEAKVEQRPDQGDYRVTARGEAQPAIPGVDARLAIEYDDGAITAQADAAYARGPVSGTIRIGATNRQVDSAGNVVPGSSPGEEVHAYGGGQVTVQLTPWLQGTVGVRILGNGELELAGAIALPSTLQLFPEKSYERNIFTIGIDIPIVGVAVLGQRIGIFATISGGLDLSAGVGPGELREVGLRVTFNPDHPESTQVQGGAQLHIPTHAGLRLFVRGGLGAGIPIVSAQAGLEIGGRLGLEGAVDAGVNVDWMPSRGLVLDAFGEIFVEPRFRFDVTGYVLVEADLLLGTIELYSRRWELAAIEYGSGLRLGMRFPIHYEEGRPFDISWSDMQWQLPDVNPREVLEGLVRQIA